jgi:hypothetical protein
MVLHLGGTISIYAIAVAPVIVHMLTSPLIITSRVLTNTPEIKTVIKHFREPQVATISKYYSMRYSKSYSIDNMINSIKYL